MDKLKEQNRKSVVDNLYIALGALDYAKVYIRQLHDEAYIDPIDTAIKSINLSAWYYGRREND